MFQRRLVDPTRSRDFSVWTGVSSWCGPCSNYRPRWREAVLLRDVREFSYQEIAHRLGLPDGTVKSRINRGRRELARQIATLEREQAAEAGSRTTTPHVTASGAEQ